MATIRLDFANPQLPQTQRARLPQGGANLPRMPLGLATAPGEQLAEAGQALVQLATETRRARAGEELAGAEASYIIGLAELRERIERGEVQGNIADAYSRGAAELRERIGGSLADPEARGSFARAATIAAARDHVDMLRLDARRTAESARAQLDTELQEFSRAAMAATDPAIRGRMLDSAERAIAARVAAGTLGADDASRMRAGFFGRLDQAVALRALNDDPAGTARRLSTDPTFLPNLDPVARERLAISGMTQAEARAARGAAAADRAERRLDREAQQRADEAEKAFNDSARLFQQATTPEERAAAEPRMMDALRVLRRDGRPGAYASAADRVFGAQERPQSPQETAWLERRLRERESPLTREELEQARADRRINDSTYRQGLERLSGREDARFREAEDFVRRALPVPSPTIADRDLQPYQREARMQADRIVNDLVLARRRNPDLDPLDFVRERLSGAQDPARVVEQQRATEALRRLPPEVQTPEGLDDLSARWATYEAARAGRGWFGRTPEPPRMANGLPVTADFLARARRTQEQAGIR